jgi:phosphate transport system substrate-binding protein
VGVDDGKDDNGSGPVEPSAETVRTGTYQPLSRPLFIYVAERSAERPEVRDFVDAYFSASALVEEVGYIPLPQEIYDLARQHFAARKTGTAFGDGGSQVGLTLEDLLAREQ